MMIDYLVIGGGAAGIFGAIAAKTARPDARVVLLEKSAHLLTKVRISGGGRCNVTHACFDPLLLTQNYPRGSKELLGPFHRFQPRDTIQWFESRGVPLKTERDGRIFPQQTNQKPLSSASSVKPKKWAWRSNSKHGLKRLRKGLQSPCKVETCSRAKSSYLQQEAAVKDTTLQKNSATPFNLLSHLFLPSIFPHRLSKS